MSRKSKKITSRRSSDKQENGSDFSLSASKSHQNALVSHESAFEELDVQGVKVSDIIGDFGPYQIAVVIFAALRALSCAMDGLSGPFLSPSVRNFQCEACDISSPANIGNDPMNDTSMRGPCSLYLGETIKTRYEIDTSQCYFDNADSLRPDRIYCHKWSFNNPENSWLMNSLTVEQSLVCDREWLKSLSNSLYFVGATFGLLFWGVISDRYGRKTAYVSSHFVTLIFGFSALFAQSMPTYIVLRAINAFGMIGELIPRSIQVEIVATEYRFVCSIICQIGWAMGIILVPALSYMNPNYRFILAFPVVLSALMLPWLYWLPESARWLITNKNYVRARDELRRAAKINGKLTEDIDEKIEQFNRQVLREEATSGTVGKRMGVWKSILAIFTNAHLLKDTMSVFALLFVAEVVYFSLTLNVADLGGSLYINYVISGLSELVSIAFCAIILAYLSRRMCLSLLLLASTISYLLMALVNAYEDSLSMTIILAVNAFGKLTAIGNLMVIILVSQEVFPTVIRQFGTSLCITVGKAGSAVAPFTHELGQTIGQSYCFAMFSVICLSCAIIPFSLSETGNRELPDTVVDVEEGANRNKRLKASKGPARLDPNGSNYIAHYKSNESIAKLKSSKDANNNHSEIEGDYNDLKTDKSNLGLTIIADSFDRKKQQKIQDDLNNNNAEANGNSAASNTIDKNNVTRLNDGLMANGLHGSSMVSLDSGDTIGTTSQDAGNHSDTSNERINHSKDNKN